ncbi:MAG: glutamate racemase [Phaeodactylibacter sp.]|uniref:glutamate racemase n=1 Tax=Phaeodactylibacter sp. TaxID=1940289 RepID=UPI0032EDD117
MPSQAIGIFDSGIGGLSVARAIIELLPSESLLYFGDTARVPYGTKSAETIRQYSLDISRFLIESGCKAIVVACNTASAAALGTLRETWPDTPIVGMEPAVKPGANATRTGVVGVLATAGTFQSQRYSTLMQRYASDVTLLENPCIGLVEQIEAGELDTATTRRLLEDILQPMLQQQADTFVLGCTHYPFVAPLIQEIIGSGRTLINPAPAVARQLSRVLQVHHLLAPPEAIPNHQLFFSGDYSGTEALAKYMLGGAFPIAPLTL